MSWNTFLAFPEHIFLGGSLVGQRQRLMCPYYAEFFEGYAGVTHCNSRKNRNRKPCPDNGCLVISELMISLPSTKATRVLNIFICWWPVSEPLLPAEVPETDRIQGKWDMPHVLMFERTCQSEMDTHSHLQNPDPQRWCWLARIKSDNLQLTGRPAVGHQGKIYRSTGSEARTSTCKS